MLEEVVELQDKLVVLKVVVEPAAEEKVAFMMIPLQH